MSSLLVEDRGGVRTVLLNRPEKRNAVDRSVVEGLRSALEEAPGSVVILASSDPRSFSSGADLDLHDAERASVSDALYGLYLAMRSSRKIIVAAASGHAVGAGAQLLVASDLRIASLDLRIRFAGPRHGLVVGAWGLPTLVGRGRALDLCLSMRVVGSEEAAAIGLVDRVAEDPLSAARDYAAEIFELGPSVAADMKRIVSATDAHEALLLERARNFEWNGSIPRP